MHPGSSSDIERALANKPLIIRRHLPNPDWIYSHNRNPPMKARELSTARVLGSSVFSLLALPPPTTTYSGSKAALRRATTSLTFLRHFFSPNRFRPR